MPAPYGGGLHPRPRGSQPRGEAFAGPAELLAQTVGASGFEPPTSWFRTRRANRAALRPEHAPRRTRTPSLLIRSHVYGDSKRHAATRAVITRRTRPTVYRNRRAASRPARGTPTFTPTLPR